MEFLRKFGPKPVGTHWLEENVEFLELLNHSVFQIEIRYKVGKHFRMLRDPHDPPAATIAPLNTNTLSITAYRWLDAEFKTEFGQKSKICPKIENLSKNLKFVQKSKIFPIFR